jgi:hypothetical protein
MDEIPACRNDGKNKGGPTLKVFKTFKVLTLAEKLT